MDLRESENVDASQHWYYQSKLFPIVRALKRYTPDFSSLIDVGAGSGFFAKALVQSSSSINAICIDPNYPEDALGVREQIQFCRTVNGQTADVLLFIDVLEHVEDDLKLLRGYTDAAVDGCLVIVSVPAFMSLWSAHDDFLLHFRRYRLSQLRSLMDNAELEVLDAHYLFASILPAVWFVRRFGRTKNSTSDMRNSSKLTTWILIKVLSFEHRFRRNRVAGLSAFVVCRVNKNSSTHQTKMKTN